MSVAIVHASEFATIAAFARGCDDSAALCAILSAANVATFARQYNASEEPCAASDIANADIETGATVDDAARALSHVMYNCHTNGGTDCRDDAGRDAFEQLGRAILAEAAILGVDGDGLGLLRNWEIPNAPPPPSRPRRIHPRSYDDAPASPANDTWSAPANTNDACARFRAALRRLTGRAWSVSHGRGTAYCWIHVQPPKARLSGYDWSEQDSADARSLLGIHTSISPDDRDHVLRRLEAK